MALGACGGGGADGDAEAPATTAGPAKTRAELIDRGNRLCRAAQKRIRPVGMQLRQIIKGVRRGRISRSEYYVRTAKLTERTTAMVTAALSQLKALGRPPGRRHALDRYIAAAERHERLSGEIATALRRRDLRRLGPLNAQWLRQTQLAHVAARAYGFKVCGGT
jgi:hypothetical protein